MIHKLGEVDPGKIDPAGLLYLQNKYVVPGGRFNEMYGWDSYFIIRGLVRDNRIDLAQGMVENFFFEIEHYGAVLNANRTYYLTRSQPPFLTSMILAVYDAQKTAGHEDRAWLERAYDYAARDYGLWTHEPHLAGSTGLARYYDFGTGPAPESLKDETGHYAPGGGVFPCAARHGPRLLGAEESRARPPSRSSGRSSRSRFATQRRRWRVRTARPREASRSAPITTKVTAPCESPATTSLFVSARYGAATHHYAPVCLNSLLYKTEKDLAEISAMLGRKKDAEEWQKRADDRKERIQQYLWDAKRGLYFDYDFEKQVQSSYEYVTTFCPMWAGIATPEQARAIMKNLAIFEKPGGLVMSPHETGGQWDYPYAWAPNQLLADEGIRRYGFNDDADRVSYEFLSTVAENFRRDGTIREKYNAVTRSSETQVTAGYHMNIVGFGWTNGVFLELLHELPQNCRRRDCAEEQKSDSAAPAAELSPLLQPPERIRSRRRLSRDGVAPV